LAAIGACVSLLSARPAAAQGRWELSGGLFSNAIDTQTVSGSLWTFSRWPERTTTVRLGFRLGVLWGREDNVTYPRDPDYPFLVTETWGSTGVRLGAPLRVSGGWPAVKGFVEAEPGAMLYNSKNLTRYTRVVIRNKVGIDDRSSWRLGPAIGVAGGLQLPSANAGPRLELRGSYLAAWMPGGDGVGIDSNGFWRGWSVSSGLVFRY